MSKASSEFVETQNRQAGTILGKIEANTTAINAILALIGTPADEAAADTTLFALLKLINENNPGA